MTMDRPLSDTARQIWDRVVTDQGEPPTARDGDALAAYATAVARLEDARKRIDNDGIIVLGDKGTAQPHPALALESKLNEEIVRLRAAIRW